MNNRIQTSFKDIMLLSKCQLLIARKKWETFLFLGFSLFFMNSCAVGNLSSTLVEKDYVPYQRLLPVYVGEKLDLSVLEEEVYDAHFKGKFNSFRDADLRKQIEESLVRNLADKKTIVAQSSKIFESNQPIAYEDFLERLDHYEIDGILVVNLDDYWRTSTNTYSDETSIILNDEDPNAKFYCYLVDRESLKPVWMARSEVNGVMGGNQALTSKLARKVAKDLRDNGLVAPR
ncbi:hypothetical protein [Marinilabilia sp.]|uniref:hypothetical protein n=1 Tax=Marinilabilia sp. TaxID=2021252 RepID=UPI0025BAB2A3|nr:hypothetical protein [Marinilabilia sp.]